MQPETARATRRLRIFKNGEESFGGKQVIINPKSTKSWDSFLAEITRQVGSRVSVRSVHTPVNGTEVKSIEELVDKMDYVAVTTGTFKKLRYSDLKNRKPLKFHMAQKQQEMLEVVKNKMNVPGRIKDVRTGSLYIFVFANGEPNIPPLRINIPMKYKDNWDSIINEINEKMKARGKDAKSMDGELLKSVEQLEPGGRYVAVGCVIKGFIKSNYGDTVKPEFYVPLNRNAMRISNGQQLPPVESLRKKTNGSNGKSHSNPQSGAKSNEDSNGRLKTNTLQPTAFGSSGNFYAKPHKNGTAKQVNYDKDDGGLFRLKKQRNESRDVQEINEDHSTKEEIPVEKRKAEYVTEEILEDGEYSEASKEKKSHLQISHPASSAHESGEESLELTYRKSS